MIKNCKYCKKEFTPWHNDKIEQPQGQEESQQFCSTICRGNFSAKKPKIFGFNNFKNYKNGQV
jgi:hypothetical protein